MTATKISELTEVTTPDGADVLPIVSGGETKKVTLLNLLLAGGLRAEIAGQLFFSQAAGLEFAQVYIDNAGLTALYASQSISLEADTGVVRITNLPTSDPGVAGQIFSDGAPSAGVPQALKISGG